MYRKILVATDLSPSSDPALRAALSLGRVLGAEVTALHVMGPAPEARRWYPQVELAFRTGVASPGGDAAEGLPMADLFGEQVSLGVELGDASTEGKFRQIVTKRVSHWVTEVRALARLNHLGRELAMIVEHDPSCGDALVAPVHALLGELQGGAVARGCRLRGRRGRLGRRPVRAAGRRLGRHGTHHRRRSRRAPPPAQHARRRRLPRGGGH